MKRVLFVCTGNTCRSPLAEGIFRSAARQRGLAVEVQSAGVMAIDGLPISQHSAAILEEHGETSAGRFSQALSAKLVTWADLILTMTMNHKRQLLQQYPEALEKTFTLKEYASSGDERIAAIVAEQERLLSELQIKNALNEPISEQDHAQLTELEKQLPNYDIADPIGGSVDVYRACAAEIGAQIDKILDRLTE